jgi:hypothetical protein
VDISELGRAGAGSYHWTSIDETLRLHRRAGFTTTELVGFAPPLSWGPEDQWDRFNGSLFEDVKAKGDKRSIERMEGARNKFLEKARLLIESYEKDFSREETGIERKRNGSYLIHYQYPIIISRK